MIQKIEYPQQTTYFISKDSESVIQGYGKIEPSQVVETIHPTLEAYLDEQEWQSILIQNGINIEQELDLSIPGLELF
jgi:hypothetical protein